MRTHVYVIHATFAIEAASADDAELAVRRARLDDDLAPRWSCERTWWTGETRKGAEAVPPVGGGAK